MLAEYEGYVYIANIREEQVTLLTYDVRYKDSVEDKDRSCRWFEGKC